MPVSNSITVTVSNKEVLSPQPTRGLLINEKKEKIIPPRGGGWYEEDRRRTRTRTRKKKKTETTGGDDGERPWTTASVAPWCLFYESTREYSDNRIIRFSILYHTNNTFSGIYSYHIYTLYWRCSAMEKLKKRPGIYIYYVNIKKSV